MNEVIISVEFLRPGDGHVERVLLHNFRLQWQSREGYEHAMTYMSVGDLPPAFIHRAEAWMGGGFKVGSWQYCEYKQGCWDEETTDFVNWMTSDAYNVQTN